MRTRQNSAGVALKWKVRRITQWAWLDVVQIWSCTLAAITGSAGRVATARKWTQDQSLHLSGYKWVGRGSRRLHESGWHLTQCSAGWRTAAANLAPLFSLFNYALPFLRMYLKPTLLNLEPFIIKLRPTRLISSSAQTFLNRRGDSDTIGVLMSIFRMDSFFCSLFPSQVSALIQKCRDVVWTDQSDNKNMKLVPLQDDGGQISLIFLIIMQATDLLPSMIVKSVLTL